MREHEASSTQAEETSHLEFQKVNSTFLLQQINISVSFMAGNHLFLFINRKIHNKLPGVISSGAFWGWISVGAEEPTKKLLLLIINVKQGRVGAEA